jgi:hypothetical protein
MAKQQKEHDTAKTKEQRKEKAKQATKKENDMVTIRLAPVRVRSQDRADSFGDFDVDKVIILHLHLI